jgi:ribosomal protein S18 acetylase RimI-like enzyme
MTFEIEELYSCKDRWSNLSLILDLEMNKIANIEIDNIDINKVYERFIQDNCKVIFVNCDGEDVGMMVYSDSPDDIVIKELFVLEDFRSKGIGKDLLNIVKSLAGNRDVSLGVTGGNERALRFYQREGFEIETYSMKLKKRD